MDIQLISVEALPLSYDVFVVGAESSFLEEPVIHGSFNTSEALDGIHIIL